MLRRENDVPDIVLQWHKALKEEREASKDEHRSGRQSTSKPDVNVARNKAVLDFDRRLSLVDCG